MKRIYKYPFEVGSLVTIDMPEGAEILSVQIQAGTPCLWAMVDPAVESQINQFTIIGTGHDIPDIMARNLEYVSTFQDGKYVWHFFKVSGG